MLHICYIEDVGECEVARVNRNRKSNNDNQNGDFKSFVFVCFCFFLAFSLKISDSEQRNAGLVYAAADVFVQFQSF